MPYYALWAAAAARGPPRAGDAGSGRAQFGARHLAVAAFWVSRSPRRQAVSWLNFFDGSPIQGAAFSVRSALRCRLGKWGVTRHDTHDGARTRNNPGLLLLPPLRHYQQDRFANLALNGFGIHCLASARFGSNSFIRVSDFQNLSKVSNVD